MMAMQQAIVTNPILMQAAMRRLSPDRILDSMFTMMNFNPKQIEKTVDELEQLDAEIARTQQAQQMMAPTQGGAPPGGGSVQGEANQMANPLSGMTANG